MKCGIRENEKCIEAIRDFTATREGGFTKILARETVLGKKAVLEVEMTEVRDRAGLP